MRFMRLTIPRPLVGIIFLNRRWVRLGVTRRLWLLPILVRTILPVPVIRNRFDVALCVLILYFFTLFLRGTIYLLSYKIRGFLPVSAEMDCRVIKR